MFFILRESLGLFLTFLVTVMVVQLPASWIGQEPPVRELVVAEISLDRSSPALIATEHLDWIAEDKPFGLSTDSTPLGVPVGDDNMAMVIELEADDFSVAIELASDDFVIETKVEVLEVADQKAADTEWINSLNDQLRRRLLEADHRYGILDESWEPPKISDLIQDVVEAHQVSAPVDQQVKYIPTASGEPIKVARADTSGFRSPAVEEELTRVLTPGLPKAPAVGPIHLNTTSGYSTDDSPVAVTDVQHRWSFMNDSTSDGNGSFPYTSGNSAAVVESRRRHHAPAVSVARSADGTTVRMYANSMIRSLLQIVDPLWEVESRSLNDYSLIIGEVKMASESQEGKTITLLGSPDSRAIYFNEYFLPDPNLRATSSNGLFVFVEPAGSEVFVVEAESEKYGIAPQLVLTRPGHVSYVSLPESGLEQVELVFHNFEKQGQLVNIENRALLEFDQAETSVPYLIDLPKLSNFQFVNLELETGIRQLLMLDGDQLVMDVPVVTSEILEKVNETVELDPAMGILALSYENADFEIHAKAHGERHLSDPVFLSLSGEVATTPFEEGFVIIPNIPPGLFEFALFGGEGEVTSGIATIEESVMTVQSIYLDD